MPVRGRLRGGGGTPIAGDESSSQPPHPDADIIAKIHLALLRGITRKHAQLR
jgi:hypothetical protein